MEDEDVVRCAFCGADLPPGSGLELDLRPRDAPDDEADDGTGEGDHPDPAVVAVCSHRHAARWLDGDTPPALRLGERPPLGWVDRVTVGSLLVVLALLVGLTLVGAWTAIGWLR